MKFGHVFKQTLKSEGFPPEWVDSAISYSQLKKCINRLANELTQVGLDPTTLSRLLQQVEDYNASTKTASGENGVHDKPLEYLLDENTANINGEEDGQGQKRIPFQPKLLFYVNEDTGELDSAQLNEETRQRLQMLAVESGVVNLRVVEESDGSVDSCSVAESASTGGSITNRRPGYRTVEIPLTSDSEFFSKLLKELSGLERLREKEEQRMHLEIEALGKQVAVLTDPDRKANRKLITAWRKIFQVYLESDIFFGTTEADHKSHNAEKAADRFQQFSNTIAQNGYVDQLKKPENIKALNAFMHINQEILQGLRFGEINRMAMMKILKKFDKQTALPVKSTFPRQIEYPEFSEHLAKAVCAEVNTQILSHVPQIDDYSCPMCFELKWRPVRLSCQHTFCIRCLIVMQQNQQYHCPLCREESIRDANSENLDLELADYLKKWFPEEVKTKQKYNELMAGVDEYGEVYHEKCTVM